MVFRTNWPLRIINYYLKCSQLPKTESEGHIKKSTYNLCHWTVYPGVIRLPTVAIWHVIECNKSIKILNRICSIWYAIRSEKTYGSLTNSYLYGFGLTWFKYFLKWGSLKTGQIDLIGWYDPVRAICMQNMDENTVHIWKLQDI